MGLNQVEIGRRLGGLDYTAVSRERKRLKEKLPLDRRLNEAMGELERMLMSKVKI
jgi:hypothetical protein